MPLSGQRISLSARATFMAATKPSATKVADNLLLRLVIMAFARVHLNFVHHLVVRLWSALYERLVLVGVRSGSFRRNATTSHRSSSSCVTPQAGMPVILSPCFTTQNCSAGVRSLLRRSSGALG